MERLGEEGVTRPMCVSPSLRRLACLALLAGGACTTPTTPPIGPSTAVSAAAEIVPPVRAPGWVAYHRPSGPPMTLTTSDGTGLSLRELDARGVIEEPLAFTELRLAFDNPEARTLEG